jgi:hypothetical protein
MTIEKNREGAWVIYALGREGYLVTRSYYGYTKRESVRLFRALYERGKRMNNAHSRRILIELPIYPMAYDLCKCGVDAL